MVFLKKRLKLAPFIPEEGRGGKRWEISQFFQEIGHHSEEKRITL